MIPSLKLRDYFSVQALKPCSIIHLDRIPILVSYANSADKAHSAFLYANSVDLDQMPPFGRLIRVRAFDNKNFYAKYSKMENIHLYSIKLEIGSSK